MRKTNLSLFFLALISLIVLPTLNVVAQQEAIIDELDGINDIYEYLGTTLTQRNADDFPFIDLENLTISTNTETQNRFFNITFANPNPENETIFIFFGIRTHLQFLEWRIQPQNDIQNLLAIDNPNIALVSGISAFRYDMTNETYALTSSHNPDDYVVSTTYLFSLPKPIFKVEINSTEFGKVWGSNPESLLFVMSVYAPNRTGVGASDIGFGEENTITAIDFLPDSVLMYLTIGEITLLILIAGTILFILAIILPFFLRLRRERQRPKKRTPSKKKEKKTP